MPHADVVLFLCQIAALLAAAALFGQIMRRVRLPVVIGEFLSGIMLGPTVFGVLAPVWQHAFFPPQGPTVIARDAVARLGLLLFLFLAGTEVDLSHFRSKTRSILWTSFSGMLLPFASGLFLVLCFPGLWGDSIAGDPWRFAFLIGTALSISALPVIARILKDLNLLRSELGLVVISAATADDLIGWTLFGLLLTPPVNGPISTLLLLGKTIAVITGILLIGRRICRPLLQRVQAQTPDVTVPLGLTTLCILLASAATESCGLHAVLGAFLIGVALKDDRPGAKDIGAILGPPVLGLLTPIYFVSVGLKADFAAHFDPLLILIVTAVACLGKIVGGSFGAWIGGMKKRPALAVGFGMNARGAMAIILATVAQERGLIDQRIFVALVFMALFTSLISGPAMRYLLRDTMLPETAKS